MAGNAVSGHGALIAMELDPTGMPNVFTTIAELNGDIVWPAINRPVTETTPHNANIDCYVLGRLGRGDFTFSVNFIFDNTTHDHLTGLYDAIILNETRGFQLRGPGGLADTDEWIASGEVAEITNTSPVREGARTADVTVRFSGPQVIDGVAIGT